jgi:hypothetical protein
MTAETDTNQRSAQASAAVRRDPQGPRSGSRTESDLVRAPRRYGQWTGAVLFVVLAALAAGWLWQQRSDRVEILTVDRDVPAGSVVERSDLKVEDVAGLGNAIPASSAGSVIGQIAAVPLVAGQVLSSGMLTNSPLPGPGKRVVGIQLDATRAPTDLGPGDIVTILAVPPTGNAGSLAELASPHVLAARATVVSAEPVAGEGTRLTMLVDRAVANRVASFGSAGRVAVLQAPIGGD